MHITYLRSAYRAAASTQFQPPTVWRYFVSLCLALMLAACGKRQSGGLTITGSTSVTPFAEQLAELYQRDHHGTTINIQGLGSSAGIRAALDGVAEIGMSSRDLQPEEADKLDADRDRPRCAGGDRQPR